MNDLSLHLNACNYPATRPVVTHSPPIGGECNWRRSVMNKTAAVYSVIPIRAVGLVKRGGALARARRAVFLHKPIRCGLPKPNYARRNVSDGPAARSRAD